MRNNCIGIRKSRLDSVLNCKDVKFNIDSILMESMFLHPWRENNGKTTLMFFQHLTFQEIIMYSAQTLNRLLSFLLCAAYTSPVLPPPIFITTDYYYLDGFFEMNIFKISFPRVNWMHGFYAPDTFPFSYLESLFLFCGFLNILKKNIHSKWGCLACLVFPRIYSYSERLWFHLWGFPDLLSRTQ